MNVLGDSILSFWIMTTKMLVWNMRNESQTM